MKKLHFVYGVMGSSKSADAVMRAYHYHQIGFNVLVLKSAIDTRENSPVIKSRSGLRYPCKMFDKEADLLQIVSVQPNQIVIVDESQFCTKEQIDQLKALTLQDVEVFCYGLKTNFKTELFEGSKRLLEIADDLHEIESACRCGNKATVNARLLNGRVTTTGAEVQIGGDESYEGMCFECFEKYQHEDIPKLHIVDTEDKTK